jgi:amidase
MFSEKSPSSPEPSAREWLTRLERRDVSSAELVARVLARIEAVNPKLNAAVAIDGDRALLEAERADASRLSGRRLPLLGLPITVKDSLATAGLVTTCGSIARAGVVPEHDATAVGRLREAGAIVVAKSNVPEYQWRYETDNALHGRTSNPLDLGRTAGGSSGGEAALLGADASIAGVGTDGGGSIRVPAHFCGIVGLRPTAGLVPETGVWPPTRATGMGGMLCVGPMARYVDDLWPLLRAMAGPDDVDPYAVPAEIAEAPAPTRRLRVAWYVDDGVLRAGDGVRAAVGAAADALARRGHDVVESGPPDVGEATDLLFGMMAADGAARARADLTSGGEDVHPSMTALLERLAPNALSAAEYFALVERAFALRARVRRHVGRHDVLVCPVTAGRAPPHGSRPGTKTGAEVYNAVHTYALAGLPSVSVPVAEEDGLPLGVQVVAGAFRDRVAIAVARQLEEAFGGFASIPAAGRRL